MTIFFTISSTVNAIAAWFYFGTMQLANFKSGILDYSYNPCSLVARDLRFSVVMVDV
jgi:hypothetical protein